MSAPAPVVLFDMSGVVFTNGTRLLVQQLAGETGAAPAGLERFFSGPESWALRRGEISSERFWTEVGPQLDRLTGIEPKAIRERWFAAFIPQDGMIELLAELAAEGIALGTVAETTEERVTALFARHPHDRYLRHEFYSFRHGVDKRDGRLFAMAAARLQPADRPAYMIEDDAASAAQANALGFTSILFADAAGLRGELIQIGVLRPSRGR